MAEVLYFWGGGVVVLSPAACGCIVNFLHGSLLLYLAWAVVSLEMIYYGCPHSHLLEGISVLEVCQAQIAQQQLLYSSKTERHKLITSTSTIKTMLQLLEVIFFVICYKLKLAISHWFNLHFSHFLHRQQACVPLLATVISFVYSKHDNWNSLNYL